MTAVTMTIPVPVLFAVYQVDHAQPGAAATHRGELGFVFGAPKRGDPPLQAYWTAFVRTGDPDRTGLPRWPRCTQHERAYLAFGQDGPIAATRLRAPICDWRGAF